LKAWKSSLPKQEKKRCKRKSTRRRRLIGSQGKLVIWGKRTQNFETKLQTMMNSFVIKESVSLQDNSNSNRSLRSHNNLRFHNNNKSYNRSNNKFKLHRNKQALVQVSSTRDLELAANKELSQMFKEKQPSKNSKGKRMKFKMKWICRIRTTSQSTTSLK